MMKRIISRKRTIERTKIAIHCLRSLLVRCRTFPIFFIVTSILESVPSSSFPNSSSILKVKMRNFIRLTNSKIMIMINLHSLFVDLNANLSADCFQRAQRVAQYIDLFVLLRQHFLLYRDRLVKKCTVVLKVAMMIRTIVDVF